MSKSSFNKLVEVDRLINCFGKDGIKLLLLFKLLKMEVKEYINTHHPAASMQEDDLNEVCIEMAYRLIRIEKETPNERDIIELALRLARY